MTASQRADIEAIINAIGVISITEALNAIDELIGSDTPDTSAERAQATPQERSAIGLDQLLAAPAAASPSIEQAKANLVAAVAHIVDLDYAVSLAEIGREADLLIAAVRREKLDMFNVGSCE